MQKLEQKGYTRDEVIDMLHARNCPRTVKFKYILLDKNDSVKKELINVSRCDISMSAFADIKRVANITLQDDNEIDWLNDRIQPFFMIKTPDNIWLEWSLGIFLLSSPTRQDQSGVIIREISCYDGLQVLIDDKFDSRYFISAGTTYFNAVKGILEGAGISKINIESSTKTIITGKEFELGTNKLTSINSLLQELNYTSLWVDENGYYTAEKYYIPSDREPDYYYSDDSLSVMYNNVVEELDIFSIPNKWVVVCSNSEIEPLTSVYTNDNPNSITSTINRNRTIVDYRQINDIADQEALNNYTKRIAFNDSQVYGNVTFDTAIIPIHSFYDVLMIRYLPLGIDDKYVESNWSMTLEAGGKMKHTVRRLVNI